jgi:hypothetical protein
VGDAVFPGPDDGRGLVGIAAGLVIAWLITRSITGRSANHTGLRLGRRSGGFGLRSGFGGQPVPAKCFRAGGRAVEETSASLER